MRWPEKGWRDKVRVQGLDEGYECGAGLWRVGGRNTVRDYVGVQRLHARVMTTITVISAALPSA